MAILKRGESAQYKMQQQKYGVDYWWTSYFSVFLFEMFQVLIISLPLINILVNPEPLINEVTPYDVAGIFAWTLGFYFECVADYELFSFLQKPANANRTLKTGLWKLCRHPNYFGETLIWFGFYLFNLNYSNGSYFFFSALFVPVLLYLLTGANVIEKDMMSRTPDYAMYTKTTPAFVPSFTTPELPVPEVQQPTGGQ